MANRQRELKCELLPREWIRVWADPAVVLKIMDIEGVAGVEDKCNGHYDVCVDARYSKQEIADEINALG